MVDTGTGNRKGAFEEDCPSRVVLNHVASRWGVLILTSLHGGPMRFHELRDGIGGISEKMLAQNLRLLARDGLVERSVEASTPPRVSYALTPLGRELSSADHVCGVKANKPSRDTAGTETSAIHGTQARRRARTHAAPVAAARRAAVAASA